ncbi:MAG TPA: hypothetical protein VG269_04480 [Tepidisphaeraceae bacterium]|nr:hypothetical protein [Tepidisphaeraceae bacterium]
MFAICSLAIDFFHVAVARPSRWHGPPDGRKDAARSSLRRSRPLGAWGLRIGGALLALPLLNTAAVRGGIAAPTYTMTDLGALMSVSYSWATGINNSGQVVGYFGVNGDNHAFLYSGGTVQTLDALPGDNINGASRINSSGQVIGTSGVLGDPNVNHAFLYSAGQLQALGTLGGATSSASGINASGQVAGSSTDAAGYQQAFLYSGGVMQNIAATYPQTNSDAAAINDGGQVVGNVDFGNSGVQGFLYTGGTMQFLGSLGGSVTIPEGMNNAGQVVGGSTVTPGEFDYQAFVYSDGKMQPLGTLGFAYGINDSGEIVGESDVVGQGAADGFLYDNGTLYDLNDLISKPLPGYVVEDANQINDEGEIAATARNALGECRAVLLTPTAVPLPTAAWASLTALPLVIMTRKHLASHGKN